MPRATSSAMVSLEWTSINLATQYNNSNNDNDHEDNKNKNSRNNNNNK